MDNVALEILFEKAQDGHGLDIFTIIGLDFLFSG